MDISMVGIDYSKAAIEYREMFALTVSNGAKLAHKIVNTSMAEGCVVISTCNRTELWFSGLKGSPLEIFLREKGVQSSQYDKFFTERYGEEAIDYLFELSCGLHSQIFGEDQILSQVKTALQNGRENNHVDSVLETLFRMSITAAKRVKTDVKLTSKNMSVPEGAAVLLEQKIGDLKGKNCLVIGNGEMGRLMAEILLERGCKVSMTLRQYKKQDAVIPEGCSIISYEDRYENIAEKELIFSATLSPHFTMKKEEIEGRLKDKDYIFIDLAVPRDIDPSMAELKGVKIYDMDKLGMDRSCNKEEIYSAKAILNKYKEEFLDWFCIRKWIPVVKDISEITGEVTDAKLTKVYKSIEITKEDQNKLQKNIQTAAKKAVAKLILDLRDHMETEKWCECITALEAAAKGL